MGPPLTKVLVLDDVESLKVRCVDTSRYTHPDSRPVSTETLAVIDVRALSSEDRVACGGVPTVTNDATFEVALPSRFVDVTRV